MSVAATIEGCSPIWADYVWFARSNGSRLYPVVREFLTDVDSASRSVSAGALAGYDLWLTLSLVQPRFKYFLYSGLGRRRKIEKYRNRLINAPRTRRDAALNIGVRSLSGGMLSQVMHRYGSDKGVGRHNYTLVYDKLFGQRRERVARIFELGIGAMGAGRAPGASLKGWREYFPNALIFGADIDERLLFEDDRITTALVDQTDPVAVGRIFKRFGGQFDLMIDDGCHQFEANKVFFELAFDKLKDDGIYVIEDVISRRRDDYKTFLRQYDAAILDIPHGYNHEDNCLAIVVKG
jgi:hypothetical protein